MFRSPVTGGRGTASYSHPTRRHQDRPLSDGRSSYREIIISSPISSFSRGSSSNGAGAGSENPATNESAETAACGPKEKRRSVRESPPRVLEFREAVAQSKGVIEFLCVCYKVTIRDRIISVTEEPLWLSGSLSGGRRKRQLSHSYNGLGLCDSVRGRRAGHP